MLNWPFHTTLLLAPLAYAIHHTEENLIFDFRVWRLRYFADNNALSTEAVFVLLTAITLIYILMATTLRTRAAGWVMIIFLMASQVVNTVFHLGGTLVFQDFSPGLITALLVYVPVNVLILRAALRDGVASPLQLWAFFAAGGALFASFEVFGPITLLLFVLISWVWIIASAYKENKTTHGEPA